MSSAGSYGGGGGGGGVGNVKFLTGNSGGPVGPDLVGNINVIGSGDITVAGNAGTETLTISLTGAIANVYDADTGSATPALGILNINGASGLQTTASGNTVIIETNGDIAITYDADSGTATAAAGILSVLGGTGIATSAAGSTITISSTTSGVTSIQGDTGGPLTGALIITGGGTGLLFDTSGSPDILLEANFLSLPDTNNILTTGYIAIGGTPVLAMCGGVANSNVCVGPTSGSAGMTGIQNICVGAGSLSHGSSSASNTVSVGTNSCQNLASGNQNVSIGTDALNSATSSTGNTVIGYSAATGLLTGTDNVVIGVGAAGNYTSSESGNVVIAANGVTGESNTLHLASGVSTAYIGGIYGVSVGATNAAVFIDNTGKLGTVGGSSSAVSSITGNGGGGSVTGAVTLTGGTSGAVFTGSGGNTLTESFNFLALPDTNNPLTQGYISINNNTFLATYGGTANHNIALGVNAGNSAMSGTDNILIGFSAGSSMTSDTDNIAIGLDSLQNASGGGNNVSVGTLSLRFLTGGAANTAIGASAGRNYTGNETGNICIGSSVLGTTGESHAIHIGDSGSSTTCFIGGIAGVTVANSAAVLIDTSANQLGTVVSSRRFKENIEDIGSASRDIYKLRPVKFNYKGDFAQSYGLIAEDVEEVMPYLVAYDKEGLPVTVKYHELPTFLLSEIQRLKLKIEELEGKLNARVR